MPVLLGESDAFRRVLEMVALVAPTDAAVLIQGESGTGKELIAHEIHRRSARRRRPLVRVNCAAIPESLYESEFFGHVRGAFTGAVSDRKGRFTLAEGGTLLLDEVGEIPLSLQAKLLRVLQEGEFERIGDPKTTRVDVRVLASTNRRLLDEVKAGRFREDLYYRLNVFPLSVPALRERREDIVLLARHYLSLASRSLGHPELRLSSAQEERLTAHDWPGNVRELKNLMKRVAILSREGRPVLELAGRSVNVEPTPGGAVLTEAEMEERVKENLRRALRRCAGKVYGPGGAAELLGVKPTTLSSRLKRYGIERGRTAG